MTDNAETKVKAVQQVIPMLSYRDGARALKWLAGAFGFVELDRRIDATGRLTHGEMSTGRGTIMLATPSVDYEGPRRHRTHCERARRWSEVPHIVDGVLAYVDRVDDHHERAAAAGATVLSAPEGEPGHRRYRVEDIGGHRWMFCEPAD